MKKLWAPWRIHFILEKKEKACIFCKFPRKKNDRDNLILFRGKKSFVILNKYPYNNGHLMVVPYRHTTDLKKLDSETRLEIWDFLEASIDIFKQALGAEGHNIGMNLEKAGGAGIVGHLHFHVVPRWVGDTNFMPILAENKVMLEYLHQTYDRLFPYFEKLKRK